MVCACCGGEMAPDGLSCSCGARVIGPPLTEPEFIVPKVGRPVLALVLAVLSLAAIVWKWVLPLTLVSLLLARTALRKIKADPRHFGGRRTAITAMTLSSLIFVAISIWVVAGIPKYLRYRAESQRAATRAQMYKVAIALNEYKRVHGTYPARIEELNIEGGMEGDTAQGGSPVVLDYWDNRLKYRATAEIAADSKNEDNSLPFTSFNEYQLVSPGPDGKMGTNDDLVMRDGIIVSPSKADIPPDEESLEE